MSDNFVNYPETIGEIRSAKSNSAADWTARDCLINLLRDIDAGLKIESIVVCFEEVKSDKNIIAYRAANTNGLETVGLLESVKTKFVHGFVG